LGRKWHEKAPKIGVWGFVNRIGFEPMTYCLEGSDVMVFDNYYILLNNCKSITINYI